ncbi:hypothetical protein T492DRAFT_393252 [Pavlovales sp. CCMP2436]|nr:hypothetical protein T492DRAFT_393252 [Pavlovales sp. CCMP2436]
MEEAEEGLSLRLELDGRELARVPFALSPVAEASVDFRRRAVELTRARALRCRLYEEGVCVCDTGPVDLTDGESWVELTSNANRQISMRAVEVDGWVVVFDVMQVVRSPVVLLAHVRCHRSAHARAPPPLPHDASGALAASPTYPQLFFDARERPRRHQAATWSECVPTGACDTLHRDGKLPSALMQHPSLSFVTHARLPFFRHTLYTAEPAL